MLETAIWQSENRRAEHQVVGAQAVAAPFTWFGGNV
jgi:hypothetical protein